jgi:hypothetical protein
LQRTGLVLRSQHHNGHHTSPFTANYCIVNGWCNPLLNKIDFWRRTERAVSRVTGLIPREDEVAIIATQGVTFAESTGKTEAAHA